MTQGELVLLRNLEFRKEHREMQDKTAKQKYNCTLSLCMRICPHACFVWILNSCLASYRWFSVGVGGQYQTGGNGDSSRYWTIFIQMGENLRLQC